VLASTVPVCKAYDPAFAYEMGTIIEHGLQEMYGDDPNDVYYYLTLYNENYQQPPRPEGVAEGIIKGLYRFAEAPDGPGHRASILFSGSAQKAAREAQVELAEKWDVAAELWSATSYKALREEALSVTRWNRLHPTEEVRVPWLTEQLAQSEGPVVAVSDFMHAVSDQIIQWVPRRYITLGTDGFGRSDTRAKLRRFFETDTAHVVVATLTGLAADGAISPEVVEQAIKSYGIDADAPDPYHS
jgi:pyruvate dehydrogenase E1 component